MIGRVKAGGLTLREVEAQVKKQLKDGGYFVNPQITVSIEQYKSQKVYIVGEVRLPGMYPLSGDMTLIEVLAKAGSTLPSASGEVVIVHAAKDAEAAAAAAAKLKPGKMVEHVHQPARPENGVLSQNAALKDGDNMRDAPSVYIFDRSRARAYCCSRRTSVLQALSLARQADRGSTSRIKIVRGQRREKGNQSEVDRRSKPRTIIVGERSSDV
jgi:polysaccharide export outer membrane protein